MITNSEKKLLRFVRKMAKGWGKYTNNGEIEDLVVVFSSSPVRQHRLTINDLKRVAARKGKRK